jgi:hypothetical protein
MYRKTLVVLACAVISAPAFAQSSDFSYYRQQGLELATKVIPLF